MAVGVRRAATRPGDLRGVRIPSGPGNHRRHRAHQRGIEFDFGASDRIRTCDPRFIRGSGSFGRRTICSSAQATDGPRSPRSPTPRVWRLKLSTGRIATSPRSCERCGTRPSEATMRTSGSWTGQRSSLYWPNPTSQPALEPMLPSLHLCSVASPPCAPAP